MKGITIQIDHEQLMAALEPQIEEAIDNNLVRAVANRIEDMLDDSDALYDAIAGRIKQYINTPEFTEIIDKAIADTKDFLIKRVTDNIMDSF